MATDDMGAMRLPTDDVRPKPFANRPRWLVPVVAIGAVILLVVLPIIGSYNGMVDKDENVDREFSNLDAQLQRRHDLIPNLVNAVQGALSQEQEVFGQIAEARQNYVGAGSEEERLEASNQESSALGRLLVIMENYPELRSNDNILGLQDQLEGTENRIAVARRDYNEVVTDYNKSVRRFPRNLTAGIFGFDKRPVFAAPPEATDNPEVDLNTDLNDE